VTRKWVKQKQHLPAAVAGSTSVLASSTVLLPGPVADAGTAQAEARMSTPPSIPARHQSFGWEAAADGSLVMQRPATTPAAPGGGSSKGQRSSPNRPSRSTAGSNSGSSWAAAGRQPSQALRQRLQAAPEQNHHHQQQQRQQQPSSSPRYLACCPLRLGTASALLLLQCCTLPAVCRAPRLFKCTAGGKLVPCTRAGASSGNAAFASKSARLHQQVRHTLTQTSSIDATRHWFSRHQ
jgi:hypothetical protein